MGSLRRCGVLLVCLGAPVFAGSSVAGIHNFDRVDERVYRGAQPTEEGFRLLAKMGVKTVLDLRENDARSTRERQMVGAAGMRYVNVPMTGLKPPTDAEIGRILDVLEDQTSGPVFVHCKHGADRTGVAIAAYRIEHDGWDNARALREAKAHHMGCIQFPRRKYIRHFRARGVA